MKPRKRTTQSGLRGVNPGPSSNPIEHASRMSELNAAFKKHRERAERRAKVTNRMVEKLRYEQDSKKEAKLVKQIRKGKIKAVESELRGAIFTQRAINLAQMEGEKKVPPEMRKNYRTMIKNMFAERRQYKRVK